MYWVSAEMPDGHPSSRRAPALRSAPIVQLQAFGYRVPATGNAARTDYANTVVMYRRGYRGDALRLAHDMHVKVVGPLDGMKPAALHGGQLAVLLGAR